MDDVIDLFIIGGGINGAAIARDGAGRGLSVKLAEMNDLASSTSSASTKLFHGGLRYLDYFEFGLVKKALQEREILLQNMPHISWPMRFVIPFDPNLEIDPTTPSAKFLGRLMPWTKGRRPAWVLRAGLFIYDHLGGRKILPATRRFQLKGTAEGAVLLPKFDFAFEYSDAWVDDARLVVLNARDAQARGAAIMTRTKVIRAIRQMDMWLITTKDTDTGKETLHKARVLVNAGGPWVEKLIHETLGIANSEKIRLVRGSHIVTKKLYDHDKAYFLQGRDGRIIFTIPYEDDFTLIGTTELPEDNPDTTPVCSHDEADYLRQFASSYFQKPIARDDIVWRYAGVRPLYEDDAKSATAATREYVLSMQAEKGAPLLNVFGGKITTHRKLAEDAMDKIGKVLKISGAKWTANAPLAGGDFALSSRINLFYKIEENYPMMSSSWCKRVLRCYGTQVFDIFDDGLELGRDFGAGLYQREVDFLVAHEFAQTAEDIVWRRTKLGLRMSSDEISNLDAYVKEQ